MLIYLPPLPTFLQTFFQILTFDVQKKRTKLPELGSGVGGLGDSGNARKKTFFFYRGKSEVLLASKKRKSHLLKPFYWNCRDNWKWLEAGVLAKSNSIKAVSMEAIYVVLVIPFCKLIIACIVLLKKKVQYLHLLIISQREVRVVSLNLGTPGSV